MAGSINNPCSITDKAIEKYGKRWANTDFVTDDIYEQQFKNDPMNTRVGSLYVGNTKIPMLFKHVITESTKLHNILDSIHSFRKDKERKYEVSILNKDFMLQRHEISRILETLQITTEVIEKKYQLGLYL